MALFLFVITIVISQVTGQPSVLFHSCINAGGKYTVNSTYHANLVTLLSNISWHTEIDYGFYNCSYGQSSEKVNAIGMCRGDVKPDACRSCLNDSRVVLSQLCPFKKEAIVWYDTCMLRYSNRSIFGMMEAGPEFLLREDTEVTDRAQFNQVLGELVQNLRSKAASGDSLKKFAAGSAVGPRFQTIFAFLQCTPDLSALECNECLVGAISKVPNCCDGNTNGIIGRPSCNLRFDISPFYESTPDAPPPPQPHVSPPPPPPSTTTKGNSNTSPIVIVAVIVPIGAILVLIIFIWAYSRLCKPRKDTRTDDENLSITHKLERFDFDNIYNATNGFCHKYKVGKGGFGAVYEALVQRGRKVAVKKLSKESDQGETEFTNEVLFLSKLQHRNIVKLLGFGLKDVERLLVYEFVPNKSLDYFLFDKTKRVLLDGHTRYKIIQGIASGLLYLHGNSRGRIVHRDIKASNILLDEKMNPKISDFGTAKLLFGDQTQGNTERMVGTRGYMAVETFSGEFSIKSDIYSFGVLVLEIISGLKNDHFCDAENAEHLVSIAWKRWNKRTASDLIDSAISNDDARKKMMRCMHIGLLCVQKNVADRPTTDSVLQMLNSNSLTLPVPLDPAFFVESLSQSNTMPQYYSGASLSRDSISMLHLVGV